eukprot:TRINITY_DN3599_c0_g1_i1.p1 TRINITY_DN3599_c0_g1~~TRINITY_DN3599_c0_g1_i1.p1  ORF type:complete len:364 (+),score=46.05 TRINITY_DN3599_c0_g1_i1:157-1092(+)
MCYYSWCSLFFIAVLSSQLVVSEQFQNSQDSASGLYVTVQEQGVQKGGGNLNGGRGRGSGEVVTYPLEQVQDNPFWDDIKKEIVLWLPTVVMDFPYPNMTTNVSGVEVRTFNTKCTDFVVHEEDLDLDLIPSFPNFKGVVTGTIRSATFESGVTWIKRNCVWLFPCLDANDTLTVTLSNFTMVLDVVIDINPFDGNMKPQLQSVNVTLDDVDIGVEGHWYDQWLYNIVMAEYGEKIDEMAKEAIEKVIQEKLKSISSENDDVLPLILMSDELRSMALQLEEQKEEQLQQQEKLYQQYQLLEQYIVLKYINV